MKVSELLQNFGEKEQKYFLYLIKDLDDKSKENFLKEIYELSVFEQKLVLNLLLRLSPKQLKAVIHNSYQDGPLMIIGDEISSKRTIISNRIAYHLIVRNIKSDEIFGLAFSNSNAGTIIDTTGNALPDKLIINMDINTYNSQALEILNDYLFGSLNIEKIGYKPSPKFRVLIAREQLLLLKRSLEESKIPSNEIGFSSLVREIIALKRNLISPEQAEKDAKDDKSKKIATIYKIYQAKLFKNNTCDVNDLIRLVLELFEKSSEVLDYYKNRYKMMIIDDYHYANYSQYKFIKILTKGIKNITLTSAYKINVYGWNSSGDNYANNFKDDFKDGVIMEYDREPVDVEDILKKEMFFEKGEIVEELEPAETADFNDYIEGKALIRLEKEDETNEASLVVNNIIKKAQEGIPYEKMAVVVRTNKQLAVLKKVFTGSNIPFFVMGDKLLFRDEIQDVMAMLELVYFVSKLKNGKLNNNENLALNNVLRTIFLEIKPLQLEFNTYVQLEKMALEEGGNIFSIISKENVQSDRFKTRFPLKDREIMGYFKELIDTVVSELNDYDPGILIELLTNETQYLHSLVDEGKMIGRLKAENIKYLFLYATEFVKENKAKGQSGLEKFIKNIEEKRSKQKEELKIYNKHVKIITLNRVEDISYQIYYLI